MSHRPRKRFGQNFLQDESIIHRIIRELHLKSTDNVLEIGPGLGALTVPLAKRLNTIKAIEIDTDLQAHLEQRPDLRNKLSLIKADALTLDYSQLGTELRIVGNLPYNISTPLLVRLIQFFPYIYDMTFMLQKEVVTRICAQPNTKAYGRLSVMLQYFCEVETILNVPATAFYPKPKVESAVVRLTPYKHSPYPAVDFKSLEHLVAKAFSMRRKTLINNLKSIVSREQLESLNINPQLRPEQISIEQFIHITKLI